MKGKKGIDIIPFNLAKALKESGIRSMYSHLGYVIHKGEPIIVHTSENPYSTSYWLKNNEYAAPTLDFIEDAIRKQGIHCYVKYTKATKKYRGMCIMLDSAIPFLCQEEMSRYSNSRLQSIYLALEIIKYGSPL